MKCSNCIKLIPNVLEGDITTQELNEDKKKNKLRKNYRFLKKLSPIIAACIIGVIIIANYSAISKFFIDNKVSDKNKEITNTVNLKNINPKTAKLKSIKDSDKFIVKEIPKEYGYKEIYDKDNLIITKSYLDDSSEVFLFNVNTGKLDSFISSSRPENYITDIKFDSNFVLWLECTKGSKIKAVGDRVWTVWVKNIKTNDDVFMMKKGTLNPEVLGVPVITLNNGIGTVTSLDKQGNYDKLLLLDLNKKIVQEICAEDSKKEYTFNFLGITRVQDKIIWCKKMIKI